MNKINENIYYIENDVYYKDDLKLKEFLDREKNFNFIRIDKISDIKDKEGFLLLLTMDDLYSYIPNVVDIYLPNVYEIDRYVRDIFKKFKYVIIISIEEFDYGHIPFSNMYVEFANKYFNSEKGISLLVDKLYKEYIFREENKYSRIRMSNIEKLREYVSGKEFITTKEIMDNLLVNEKWIQRYMKDMNKIYNNIGYNKKTRVWYTIKK